MRDLEWVVSAPSLLDHPACLSSLPFDADALDGEHLVHVLNEGRGSSSVGRYFEDLVGYWLEHLAPVSHVRTGVQVHDSNRRTIGEVDFLFEDAVGVLHHWEVAVKFFLHYQRSNLSDYPGPNARDNFEHKATQLLTKQLPLSVEHFPDVRVRRGLVRGMIFDHVAETEQPADLPEYLSPTCLRGTWLRREELHHLHKISPAGGHIVSKPHWLAEVISPAIDSTDRLIREIEVNMDQTGSPVLLSLRSTGGAEVGRTFVVPLDWPVVA